LIIFSTYAPATTAAISISLTRFATWATDHNADRIRFSECIYCQESHAAAVWRCRVLTLQATSLFRNTSSG